MIIQVYQLLATAVSSGVGFLSQFLQSLPLMEASILYVVGLTTTVTVLVLPIRGHGVGSDKARNKAKKGN